METFAPAMKMNTVRILLALAVLRDWNMFQLNVNNVLLNDNLKEDVYMSLPPRYEE